MTEQEYRAHPAVNWSSLKHMARSPFYYQWAKENPQPTTDPMRLGTLVHSMVLEPDTVDSLYAVWDGKVRRGKVWDAFQAEHRGRIILPARQFMQARHMADAVLGHWSNGLLTGEREHEVYWTMDGTDCKAKLDIWNPLDGVLVDLKTISELPRRDKWQYVVRDRMWHAQLSWYRQGVNASKPPQAMVIAVEAAEPHEVAVLNLGVELIYEGCELWRGLFDQLQHCTQMNEWPGTCPAPETVIEL